MFRETPLPHQPHIASDGSLTWAGYSEQQLLENVKVQAVNAKDSKADPDVDPHQRDAEGMIAKSLASALSHVTGNHQPWKYWANLANSA